MIILVDVDATLLVDVDVALLVDVDVVLLVDVDIVLLANVDVDVAGLSLQEGLCGHAGPPGRDDGGLLAHALGTQLYHHRHAHQTA